MYLAYGIREIQLHATVPSSINDAGKMLSLPEPGSKSGILNNVVSVNWFIDASNIVIPGVFTHLLINDNAWIAVLNHDVYPQT